MWTPHPYAYTNMLAAIVARKAHLTKLHAECGGTPGCTLPPCATTKGNGMLFQATNRKRKLKRKMKSKMKSKSGRGDAEEYSDGCVMKSKRKTKMKMKVKSKRQKNMRWERKRKMVRG